MIGGVGGTLAAFLHLLDHFLTFLFYLSIVFVPVASIIVVDFFFLRPAAYLGANALTVKSVETAALIAWAAGACIAVLASAGFLRLSGIAAIDAMGVSAVVFMVLKWRSTHVVTDPVG